MLPHAPEPLEALRARLPDALAPVYDPALVARGLQACPGGQRRHVFDAEDGLRLIVSRDRLGGAAHLHVSASVEPGWPLARTLMARLHRRPWRRAAFGWFIPLVERRWRELSDTPLVFHALSPEQGVPHWYDAPLPEVPDA
jgi:hypothetical protein